MKLVVLVLREGIGEPCTCAVWLVRASAKQAHSKANCFLSVLFFEMLINLRLADSILPWYLRVDPKPLYEPPDAKAYWDAPVSAKHEHLARNRVEARFLHHKENKVITEEKCCLWMDN